MSLIVQAVWTLKEPGIIALFVTMFTLWILFSLLTLQLHIYFLADHDRGKAFRLSLVSWPPIFQLIIFTVVCLVNFGDEGGVYIENIIVMISLLVVANAFELSFFVIFRKHFSKAFFVMLFIHHGISICYQIMAILAMHFRVVDTVHGHDLAVMGALWNLCAPASAFVVYIKWMYEWSIEAQIRIIITGRICSSIPCLLSYILLIYHWQKWELVSGEVGIFIGYLSPFLFFHIYDVFFTVTSVKRLYQELVTRKEPLALFVSPNPNTTNTTTNDATSH